MRVLSTLFVIAASFAISANAGVSKAVEVCTNNMSVAVSQLRAVRIDVDGFTSEQGYQGARLIGTKIEALETSMDKVAKTCCTASHPGTASVNGMAGDEIDGILSGLGQLAPEIISTLSSVAGKRTQLDELPLLKPLIAADVQKLYKSIDSLNLCILQSVPASRHAIASHLTNQMHAGFLNIMTTFDI